MGLIGAAVGAIGSVVGGVLSSGILSGSPSAPSVHLHGVDLQDPSAAFAYYLQQSGEFPAVAGFTNKVNQTDMQQYTNLLNQLYPGATKQLGQVSNIAQSYLQGQIPQDVQSQIQRATAQQALQGGYGGTGMARNLTARDFGTTSMQLQQTGLNMLGTGVGLAQSMIPGYINPGSLLFSPAQLQARQDQANYYNTDIQNEQQIVNAQSAMSQQYMQLAQQRQQGSALSSMFSNLFGSGTKSTGGQIGNFFSLLGSGVGPTGAGSNSLDAAAQDQGYLNFDDYLSMAGD
jgi:hypothetical protein